MDKEYLNFINSESSLPYYQDMMKFLSGEILSGKTIFPKEDKRFEAFAKTPFQKMKVVIFGQDPYHSANVADGLAFSTKQEKTPPSLKNIFKELRLEYPDITIKNNDLEP
jgi:uracil-DNA glycosylase